MRRPVVGELLLDPVALASVAVLLFNDHYAKAHAPGVVTGKVSDCAGLVFFPLLLATLFDVASRLLRGRLALSRGILIISVTATAIAFTLAKSTSLGAQSFRLVWGLLHWPLRALVAGHCVPFEPGHLVQDPTDLLALPMLAVSYFIGRRVVIRHHNGSIAT